MIYKILSYLFFYPNEDYFGNLHQVQAELDKIEISEKVKTKIKSFITNISAKDHYEAMSDYVSLFDNNPSCSLYMFDHIIGDSKEKGEALSDLKETYIKYGFDINTKDLPDYLPLFLEFISKLEEKKSLEFLTEIQELLNDLYLKHNKLNSIYAFLFEAIILNMNQEIFFKEVSVLNQQDLDEIWKEQEVLFAHDQKVKEKINYE